ncbi:MAG: hypothetical protein K6T75_07780 [Acetobacteraceae bacterium]|nr:hypothetical protein [Acetobacteraceae bacterium]
MSTRVEAILGSITEVKADAIVVNLFQGVDSPQGATRAVDHALGGLITQLIAQGEITGRLNTATLIHSQDRLPSPRVIVTGLGPAESFHLRRARQAAAAAALAARKAGVKTLATVVHGAGAGGQDPAQAAAAVAEASLVALYRYLEFKSRPDESPGALDGLLLVESDPARFSAVAEGARLGAVLGEATNLCRDLTMRPPNYCTPSLLAEAAQDLGRKLGLEVEVYGPAEIEALKLEGIMAVARGSQEPPRLIVARHHGGNPEERPDLALVGKGVTFDAGGIMIKTTRSIEHMKSDMAGAGAVIAAMAAAARLGVPRELVAVIPAVENLPSGSATLPGAVIRLQGGQTVEIASTDAEGRLCLADAVAYACRRLGARAVVDAATLTGSCVQAFGHYTSGLLSNHRPLEAAVLAAAEEAGERVWPLPLFEEYWELLRSDTADFKNTGITAKAGVILGALIIGQQAQNTPWAHLDIAGPAWLEERFGYLPPGATGAGTRTLALLALRLPDRGEQA